MCVCERGTVCVCVCVCVCVRERESERESARERERVCVREPLKDTEMKERERELQQTKGE